MKRPEDAALWAKFHRRRTRANLHALVEANLPLVAWIANRLMASGYGDDVEDLVQDGAIELQRVISKFDPGRGTEFSTYAEPCIRRVMERRIRQRRFGPNSPRSVLKDASAVPKMASLEAFEGVDDRPAAEWIAGDDGRLDQAAVDLRLDLDEAIRRESSSLRRRALVLRFKKGKSFRQIGAALGMCHAKAESLIRQIRRTHGDAIPSGGRGR